MWHVVGNRYFDASVVNERERAGASEGTRIGLREIKRANSRAVVGVRWYARDLMW